MKADRRPDPIIVRELAVILALLAVNGILEFRYDSSIAFDLPQETTYFVDEPFVYTPQEEKQDRQQSQQEEQQQLQHASTLLTLVDELFNRTEPARQMRPPSGLGPIGQLPIFRAQEESTKVDSFVRNLPHFPGGHDALQAYVERHFYYTPAMYDYGRDLHVVLSFVVQKNGEIADIQVISVNVPHVGLQERATELFENMPPWVPGNNGGKPLNVHVQLPLTIQIW